MSEVIVIHPTIKQTENTAKLRVCAYARVSSDSDDQEHSFIAQVTHYTDFILRNPKWEYVDVYADEAVTGLKTEIRIEFMRMINDCRAGKIDKIITKSVSRFSRNATDCIDLVRELKALGVTVIFEKEKIDNVYLIIHYKR